MGFHGIIGRIRAAAKRPSGRAAATVAAVVAVTLLASVQAHSTTLTVDITEFGAVPGDGRDDRAAIQAAIDAAPAGAALHVPAGVFEVSKSSRAWGLLVAKPLRLYGDGPASTLRLMAGQGEWARLITIDGARDVTIENLTVDGNGANQPALRSDGTTRTEQAHNIFATGSTNVVIRNVITRGSAGDGVYYHGGTSGLVEYTEAYGDGSVNPRVAFNFQGAHDAVFQHNYAQDYGVGYKAECDSSVNASNVRVVDNVSRNTRMGLATNGKSDQGIWGRDYYIAGNDLEFTDSRGLWLKDTIGLVVENNVFRQLSSGGTGFYVRGNIEDALIRNNVFVGAGVAASFLRYPSDTGLPSKNVIFEGNRFPDSDWGVRVAHDGAVENLAFRQNRLAEGTTLIYHQDYTRGTLDLTGNTFGGVLPPPPAPPAPDPAPATTTTAPGPAPTTSTTSTTLAPPLPPVTTSTSLAPPAPSDPPPTQPGSGPRRLDVRAFGAKGDGRTDDRPAIQRAIDDAARDGSTVYLPAGSYRVTQDGNEAHALELTSGVSLEGDGDATRLKLADGQGEWARLVSGERVGGARIANLVLDGNAAKQAARGQQHALFLADSEDVSIEGVTIVDPGANGIYLFGVRGAELDRLTVSGARVGVAVTKGNAGFSEHVRISAAVLRDNEVGLLTSATRAVSLDSSHLEGNRRGVALAASGSGGNRDLTIRGNVFAKGTGQTTGVAVEDPACERVSVTGNVFEGQGVKPVTNTTTAVIDFSQNAQISAAVTRR